MPRHGRGELVWMFMSEPAIRSIVCWLMQPTPPVLLFCLRMKRFAELLLLIPVALHAECRVDCDLPGIFPPEAAWRCVSSGHSGCEGAQWDRETLYYAAHHDGFAFKWSESRGLVIWLKDAPEATSFRPDGNGGFYVVEQTTRRLARWNARGECVAVLADRFEGRRLNRPNDCVVKSDGTVWFTDPDWLFDKRPDEKKELPGQFVFRFDPNNASLAKAADGFRKPNGIAFSPDERHLFISDSETPNVYRFPVKADGTLGPRETFATFGERGLDGLAFDPSGRLWCCTNDGLRIIDNQGRSLGLVRTSGKPTSLAFSREGRLCMTQRDACFVTSISR